MSGFGAHPNGLSAWLTATVAALFFAGTMTQMCIQRMPAWRIVALLRLAWRQLEELPAQHCAPLTPAPVRDDDFNRVMADLLAMMERSPVHTRVVRELVEVLRTIDDSTSEPAARLDILTGVLNMLHGVVRTFHREHFAM